MKRRSPFLAECTYAEVQARLEESRRVLVPLGATEQHGRHGPLGTDAILANEVCVRLARRIGGLVAPCLSYGYSLDHRGFPGVAWLSAPTFAAAVGDICVSLCETGFRQLVFVNGHYTNVVPLSSALAAVADRLAPDAIAFSFNYWDPLPADELREFLSLDVGLHANIGETSAILAVDEGLVDMEEAAAEWPAFPGPPTLPLVSAFFFSAYGTMYRATRSGVWGDPTSATAAQGRLFLDQVERAAADFVARAEATFEAFPPREPGGGNEDG